MNKVFKFAAVIVLMAVFFLAGIRFCTANQTIKVVGRNGQDYICIVECLGREEFYFAAYAPLPNEANDYKMEVTVYG